MPTPSAANPLSLGNLIAVVGAGVPAVAADTQAQATKTNFSSLLDLGAGQQAGDNQPRKEKAPVEDGRDMVATAIESPAALADNSKPRAKEPEGKISSPDDVVDHTAPAEEKIAANDSASAPQGKTGSSQSAQPVQQTETATNAMPAEEESMNSSSSLRAQMAALMELLSQALAALGLQAGQPGAHASANQVAGVFAFSGQPQKTGQSAMATAQAMASQADGQLPADLAAQLQEMMQALQAFFAAKQNQGSDDNQDALLNQLQSHIEKLQNLLELSSGKPVFANAEVAQAVSADPIREALQLNLNALKAMIRKETQTPGKPQADAQNETLARLQDLFSGRNAAAAPSRFVEAAAAEIAVKPQAAIANPVNVATLSQAATNAVVAAASSSQSNSSGTSAQDDGAAQTFVPTASAATPAQSGAAKAEASVFSRLLKQEAPRPVVEQVVFNIKTAVRDGSSKIHIQLDPQELGKLEIELHVSSSGKTGVVITVDQKSTLEILQKDARGLEQALADAGLSADSGSLSFNLRSQQDGREQQNFASASYQKALPQEEEVPLEVISKTYVLAASDGLDIMI